MKLNTIQSAALVTGTATLLLGSVSSAHAYTVYTSRAAWEAAVNQSTITTDTFSTDISSAQSITLDSGIVSTNSGNISLPNPPFNNNSVSGGVFNNATQAGNGTASNTIAWALPRSVFAFGADFISAGSDRLTLNGNFDGTGIQSILVNNTIGGGNGFLGIVGTAKFDSIYFGNDLDIVDGFSIDNASIASTPEPSAVVAIALVGGGLLLSKRMKRY